MLLTEEDGDEVILVKQFFQHFTVNLLDFIFKLDIFLSSKPSKNFVFLCKVACGYTITSM